MTRRIVLLALALNLALLAAAGRAESQSAMPVVGILMAAAGPDDPLIDALKEGLRELGYLEDRNIRFEYRGAQGHAPARDRSRGPSRT